MGWEVRVINETFGTVDFVGLDADTDAAAIDAALEVKGPGWSADFANASVAYVPNAYTA